eukprot:1696006-Pyramimonas_sp.AAC.1
MAWPACEQRLQRFALVVPKVAGGPALLAPEPAMRELHLVGVVGDPRADLHCLEIESYIPVLVQVAALSSFAFTRLG